MTPTALADVEAPFFDLSDPTFDVASEEVHRARERSWFARTNLGVAVLRYDAVSELIKDRRLRQGSYAWPSHHGITDGLLADWWSGMLLSKEGDEHGRLRRLVNPAFSPRVIKHMAPDFRELANELVDAFVDDGRCEFMTAFAEPYAARVLTKLLRIDERDWKRIVDYSTTLGLAFGITIAQDQDQIEDALRGLYDVVDEIVTERRRFTGDDFISNLVAAQAGDKLSDEELRTMLVLLIFGGMDTTRNQLGLAMQTFVDHPDQWRLLAERPELGGHAVEEVMRNRPTITWVTRAATTDLEYRGVLIPAGTTLHLLSESSGTDPAKIADPTFDITQERPSHFGFGGGVHYCLGHFLARLDMKEALPILAQRLRDPALDGPVRSLAPSGNTGPIELPIRFTTA
ncbi:cytochrome P450 [Nitriliruptor alkaliphilus]|uniref:cytochrome P450 n=1 Tax=Nitriliruptor alkaliphilus TaxID=427918 RepID=UPI0006970E0B|nr:cytochrome P450 [Nitriliruptor alkaliphilus]